MTVLRNHFPKPTASFLATALCLVTTSALAQGTDVGAAERLFQQAKQLLDEGNVAEACPKFAESFRLDAGTGTLLGLAICHEKEGKLASAWAEYLEVKGRAQRDGDAARLQYAEERSAELEPRLSTLSIEVGADVAQTSGLAITRNGVPVGKGSWNLPVPLDGDDYVVEVRAPGKKAWTQTVTLQVEATKGKVVIPRLEDEPTEGEAPPSQGPTGPEDGGTREAPLTAMNGMRWAGVGTAGAGVVSLGIGGYFLLTALDQNADAESECEGDRCNDRGTRLLADSVENGNMATIFGIAGTVLVGTGAVLFFVVGDDTAAVATPAYRVSAAVGPSGVAVTAGGSF